MDLNFPHQHNSRSIKSPFFLQMFLSFIDNFP